MRSDLPTRALLVGGIRLSLDDEVEKAFAFARRKLKKCGIAQAPAFCKLYKKSIDARRRDDPHFVCTILAAFPAELRLPSPASLSSAGIRVLNEETPEPSFGTTPIRERPMVVGMGPAGLFAALLLAQNGYAPILIDRGASVEERARDTETFFRDGALDPDSNVQFGAGGAGTFSDGKLVTRIHDPLCRSVLETFVRFGAPEEILVKAKPHVGTDLLRGIVSGILDEITGSAVA